MDSLDPNTRLPPRKRLLAGLKKDSLACDLSAMIPSISIELYDRLHKVINSSSHSLEEIIEEVNSVASDATEAAEAARENAMEKAAAAAKAKAAAKSALELLDLVREKEGRKFCNPVKNKLRKRKGVLRVETDEEIARRLHRAMNSSPRIVNNSEKNCGSSRKLGIREVPVGGSEDKAKATSSERKRRLEFSVDKQCNGSNIIIGKKAKIKRKKLLLSQFNVRDRRKPEEMLRLVDNALIGGSKLETAKSFNEPETQISSVC